MKLTKDDIHSIHSNDIETEKWCDGEYYDVIILSKLREVVKELYTKISVIGFQYDDRFEKEIQNKIDELFGEVL